jgi:protein ImuB
MQVGTSFQGTKTPPKDPESRRIVAVVLNQLLVELATEQLEVEASSAHSAPRKKKPMAVIVDDGPSSATTAAVGSAPQFDRPGQFEQDLQQTTIAAVNEAAHTCGVRTGQSVAEACAWVAHLHIQRLGRARVQSAIERIAESLGQFAPTISLEFPDTIWLDVSNSQQLYPNESDLLREISACVSTTGHLCRLAIAKGPLLAQAFARWGPVQRDPNGRGRLGLVVDAERTTSLAAQLPIVALPISSQVQCWLAGLGILCWADLSRIPTKQAISRLGPNAQLALDLVAGRDTQPLVAFTPPRHPHERQEWDEAVTGSQPLLFVLRGLVAKISTRLEGRGLAAQSLRLTILYDRGIARLRNVESQVDLDYTLASPLFRADDLWRILSTRLDKLELGAPSVGLELKVCSLTSASQRQLDLMSASSRLHTDPERLQVLLSELAADIGPRAFGILRMNDSHRPEKLSLLRPLPSLQSNSTKKRRGKRKKAQPQEQLDARTRTEEASWQPLPLRQISLESSRTSLSPATRHFPNRLLPKPLLLERLLTKGAFVPFAGQLFSVEDVHFDHRLDCVEWWSGENISRDYYRITLVSRAGASGHTNSGHTNTTRVCVLAYRNRHSGHTFLQGIYD